MDENKKVIEEKQQEQSTDVSLQIQSITLGVKTKILKENNNG